MRGLSLGSIRARVERLVSARLPAPAPEPLIVHWKLPDEPCPACGADLTGHAEARAVAEASADRARGDARVIYWADELTTCPDLRRDTRSGRTSMLAINGSTKEWT